MKRETKIRLMYLGISVLIIVLFWFTFNIALNYIFLALDGINASIKNQLPNGYYSFRPEYLVTLKRGMPIYSTLILAAALGLLGGYKVNRRLASHFFPNDSVEGTSRWATEKETRKYLTAVPKKNIKSAEQSGIVLTSDDKYYYIDPNTINSMVIGSSRSGKGQLSVNYLIRQISQGKMRQSMIVNDPKGELLEASYQFLQEAHYRVVVLNFRDTESSSSWNPLTVIIESYKAGIKSGDISKTEELLGELAKILTDNPKIAPYFTGIRASLARSYCSLLVRKRT